MALNLNDLINYVQNSTNAATPFAATDTLDASLHGAVVDGAVNRATTRGTVNATGEFVVGGSDLTSSLRTQADHIKQMERTIEATEKAGRTPNAAMVRNLETAKANLTRDSERVYARMADASHYHAEAIGRIEERRDAILERMSQAKEREITRLNGTIAADGSNLDAVTRQIGNVEQRFENASAHVTEQYGHMAAQHHEAVNGITHTTNAVERATSVSSAGAAAAAGSAAAKGAGKAVATAISKEAKEMGVMGEKAFGELGWIGKQKAAAKANWNISAIEEGTGKITKAGGMGRFARVAGTSVGVVLGGHGLKDLGQVVGVVSPDIDEQGKEIPADSGKLFKAAAELGAGAALVYMSLLKGGHGKAKTNIARL
jgi:hypothetical protein